MVQRIDFGFNYRGRMEWSHQVYGSNATISSGTAISEPEFQNFSFKGELLDEWLGLLLWLIPLS
jgi:hypothetical protein